MGAEVHTPSLDTNSNIGISMQPHVLKTWWIILPGAGVSWPDILHYHASRVHILILLSANWGKVESHTYKT